jgi:hypothetical protein
MIYKRGISSFGVNLGCWLAMAPPPFLDNFHFMFSLRFRMALPCTKQTLVGVRLSNFHGNDGCCSNRRTRRCAARSDLTGSSS